MRVFFIILGTAATTYGLVMLAKKNRRKKAAMSLGSDQSGTDGKILVGPSITSTAGSAENNISPVQGYDVSRAGLFPPMTIVTVPGAGSLDNMDMSNMHQIVTF